MDVLAILKKLSRPLDTVSIDQSVNDAISLMVAKKVDVLIVTEGQRPAGIFSERDAFHYYRLSGKERGSSVKLRHVIADRLVSAASTDDIADIIALMLKSDIDHLPVMEEDKILGLLALKDLVKVQLEALTEEIHQLNDYIEDLHEAAQD